MGDWQGRRDVYKRQDKEVVPAGIFYYHIGDPIADKQEEMCIRDRYQTGISFQFGKKL